VTAPSADEADATAVAWRLGRLGYPHLGAARLGAAVQIEGPDGPRARLVHDHPACWSLWTWGPGGTWLDTGLRGTRDAMLDAWVLKWPELLALDVDAEDAPTYRRVVVPPVAAGMRLDRFLAGRFEDRSRTWFAQGIREGRVSTPGGQRLRASSLVRGGDVLHLVLDGLAPDGPPPPLPPVVYEDDDLLVLDKPAGLLTHPTGTDYAWSVVHLARQAYKDERIDLVHRLDRDTSGLQVLSKHVAANRWLRARLHDPGTVKEYVALCKGHASFETAVLDGPIGPAGGEIRIQMAVRADGQSARTDVTVLGRADAPARTLVRCRIHTGRTHQIRVHLAHAGLPLVGDRLYGVPPEVFLSSLDEGLTPAVLAAAGAPRQALHAARVVLPRPDGSWLTLEAPLPADLAAWWETGPDVTEDAARAT
jgi:23S rRNA pseudouridine1911/1915/1917 synthase